MLMRDEEGRKEGRRKEGRSKHGQTNNKAKQHSTPRVCRVLYRGGDPGIIPPDLVSSLDFYHLVI